ncbi:MAG: AAA family ATPase, partial [Planctomycetota bacterium]
MLPKKIPDRLALISDIHANLEALETVLADIEQRGIKEIWCLGDILGYGPNPVECLQLVHDRCSFVLMGNHDYAVLHGPLHFNNSATSAIACHIQLLAAWMVVNDQDLPMNPRLLGKPGVGKTTLAYAAARRMGREVYILQATMDTRPEDLLVTPVIEGAGSLRYVASPLVTAMLRGGIAIIDEGNRMSE